MLSYQRWSTILERLKNLTDIAREERPGTYSAEPPLLLFLWNRPSKLPECFVSTASHHALVRRNHPRNSLFLLSIKRPEQVPLGRMASHCWTGEDGSPHRLAPATTTSYLNHMHHSNILQLSLWQLTCLTQKEAGQLIKTLGVLLEIHMLAQFHLCC